jgi:hypothetical protein
MTRLSLRAVACATLLWAGMALGIQSAQEKCNSARITAWKTYLSCVDAVVARDAGCATTGCPKSFDEFAAFAKCRHTYFNNWTTFQSKKSLAGSTCVGSRFTVTDSGATVTDGLTGLVWEVEIYSGVRQYNKSYTWSTGSNDEDGTAFTTFLTTGLNTPGFAGGNGWRLPTLAELQTIVLDFPCTGTACSCGSNPCIDETFGLAESYYYWSATNYVPFPSYAWLVDFTGGHVGYDYKSYLFYVRAVRGSL